MREKLELVCNELEAFLSREKWIPVYTFLIGKKNDVHYKIDVSNNERNTISNIKTILEEICLRIRRDYDYFDVTDWTNSGFAKTIFYKTLTEEEFDFLFRNTSFRVGDKTNFIKGRYKKRYFIFEIRLDESGNKRLMFVQDVRHNYKAKMKFHWNIFDDRVPLEVLRNSEGFTLNADYSFLVMVEDVSRIKGFIIIKKRQPFEDLMDYYGDYNSCYVQVSQLDCVDFSRILPTPDLKRRCYQLVHNRNFRALVDRFIEYLNSEQPNEIKDVLHSKGIDYEPRGQGYVIIPNNVIQARLCLRMLNDGTVKTILSNEIGITDHVEPIRP